MPTNNQEFITYGAYALKQLLGVDIAIAAMNGGNIIGIARDTRGGNARSISTPIVNLLRTISARRTQLVRLHDRCANRSVSRDRQAVQGPLHL